MNGNLQKYKHPWNLLMIEILQDKINFLLLNLSNVMMMNTIQLMKTLCLHFHQKKYIFEFLHVFYSRNRR